MDMIERHLGKFLLVFILIAGGLLVLFANDLRLTLSLDTSPPPSAAVTHPASAVEELPKLKSKAHYDLIANRNLFVFPETVGSKEKVQKEDAQPVKETNLNVRLKGTIVSPNGFALAMIEDRAQRKEAGNREARAPGRRPRQRGKTQKRPVGRVADREGCYE